MTTDNSRADALTDDQRQALGESLSAYFGKLDSDEGIRAPEGRILRAFDYCDSRNVDDLIDRAIVPALAASPVEQPAESARIEAKLRALMGAVNAYEKATGVGGAYAERIQEACNGLLKMAGSSVRFGLGGENPVDQPAISLSGEGQARPAVDRGSQADSGGGSAGK